MSMNLIELGVEGTRFNDPVERKLEGWNWTPLVEGGRRADKPLEILVYVCCLFEYEHS